MREKMLDLMKNEGLKPSQLAEMLEINPAGISHILAGRNKPGFDLLQKILRRFPQISPDWLLLDKGSMYRADKTTEILPISSGLGSEIGNGAGRSDSRRESDFFQTDIFSSASTAAKTNSNSPGNSGTPAAQQTVERETGSIPIGSVNSGSNLQNASTVARIVIFYDDQTFETYAPTRR